MKKAIASQFKNYVVRLTQLGVLSSNFYRSLIEDTSKAAKTVTWT